jgi:hypothetical protein
MRFEVGDLARLVVSATRPGSIVEIFGKGPYVPGKSYSYNYKGELRIFKCSLHGSDYVIDFNGKAAVTVSDWRLAPLEPPEEPKSLTRSMDEPCKSA